MYKKFLYWAFIPCLSVAFVKAINKWNYGTSAVQSNGFLPSQLLSPHTYLAHISSASCPVDKFNTSLHQLLFLPCLVLHVKRIWVFHTKRNSTWQGWIRGIRTLDELRSSWDVRSDTGVGYWRREEEGVCTRRICLSELISLMLNYNFNIYSNAFHFPVFERNNHWYSYNPVRQVWACFQKRGIITDTCIFFLNWKRGYYLN